MLKEVQTSLLGWRTTKNFQLIKDDSVIDDEDDDAVLAKTYAKSAMEMYTQQAKANLDQKYEEDESTLAVIVGEERARYFNAYRWMLLMARCPSSVLYSFHYDQGIVTSGPLKEGLILIPASEGGVLLPMIEDFEGIENKGGAEFTESETNTNRYEISNGGNNYSVGERVKVSDDWYFPVLQHFLNRSAPQ